VVKSPCNRTAPPTDRNLYIDRVELECSDGVQDGIESDVDCGGGLCAACPKGSSCDVPSDCQSQLCTGGVCATPGTTYTFEGGVQGWTNMDWPAISTTTASNPVYAGTRSLKVNVQSTGAGAPRVWVVPGQSPAAGTTVTYRVYLPAGAPIYAVQPYVSDQNWTWASSWYGSPVTGSWQTYSVAIPGGTPLPAREVGVKVYLSGSWTGSYYLDSVGWP
jgi:hypothetical protein